MKRVLKPRETSSMRNRNSGQNRFATTGAKLSLAKIEDEV